jgi:hypothetical protein
MQIAWIAWFVWIVVCNSSWHNRLCINKG